jgi:predicted nucleotidyltransferase
VQFGLPDDVLPRVIAVLSGNRKIRRITLYGSRAMGKSRNGSDIDLCLDGDPLSLKDLAELEAGIDDLLLPWKVYITVRQQIDNPDLIAHIERIGVILFGNSIYGVALGSEE